jgi:hypothetical protein
VFYDPVVPWLESPGGNLVWDVLLQAIGIIITVTVIRRYFERREELRWLPARQHVYARLFSHADYLVRYLPPHHLNGLTEATYQFGYTHYTSTAFPKAFTTRLVRLRLSELERLVKELAINPEPLESFQRDLDNLLGPSTSVFLEREPELNQLINELKESLSACFVTLNTYSRTVDTGRDPARTVGSSALEQACITLRELVISGYRLRQWLAAQADTVKPADY